MNIAILTNQNYVTSCWSGGSTTQLYIFPADTSYAERNFDFRISSANVEIEESTFTPLPGITRKLMVLEGEITITHENHYCKRLKKFDTDTFKGDWNTSAVGTCVDFNVMTRGNLDSELSIMIIAANHNKSLRLDEKWKTLCVYVLSGEINFEIENKFYRLKKDNLMVLSNLNKFSFPLHSNKKSELIISKISR